MTSRKPGLGIWVLGVGFRETEEEQPPEEEPEACLLYSVHCGSMELCKSTRLLDQRSPRPSGPVGVIRCMPAD